MFALAVIVALWTMPARAGSPVDLLAAAKPVAGTAAHDQLLAGKPVIVAFFASWCPPCVHEFAALNEVRVRYGADKVAIVAVNAFETWGGNKHPSRMARFVAQTMPTFPLVLGSDEILRGFGNVARIPTLVIYDKNGREVWRFVHEVDAVKRSATAREILSELERLNPD